MTALLNMTATETAGEGHNSGDALAALHKDMRKYGAMEAAGSTSRPTAAMRLVDAAFDGLVREGDAEAFYGDYQAGMVSVGKKNPMTLASPSEQVQVSKFRQFIKVGMLPGIDARELMRNASQRIADLKAAEVKIKAPFDALLDCAREQMKTPEDLLTTEQIDALITRAAPKDRDALDKLIAVYKSTYKLNEEMKSEHLSDAIQSLRDEITEQGGDVPPMTKEEKERAAFVAQAAKFGVKL